MKKAYLALYHIVFYIYISLIYTTCFIMVSPGDTLMVITYLLTILRF